MKEYLRYNLSAFLEKDKLKFRIRFVLIFLLLIALIVVSYTLKIENILKTNAQVICDDKCSLQFYNNITSFFQAKYIKINGEKYDIENINFKEPILDNQNQGYQLVTINLKEYHGNHNEIVKIEIFKNKEIVAKRIAKIIVGR